MKRFLILCLALMLPLSASAEGEAKRAAFINQLNIKLNKLATDSNFKLSYKEVSFVREPMYGDYFDFEDMTLTHLSGGGRYELSARSVTLNEMPDQPGIYQARIPSTVSLHVSSEANPSDNMTFLIGMLGVPQLKLQMDPAGTFQRYKVEAPETVQVRIKIKDSSAPANSFEVKGSEMNTPNWKSIEPFSSASVTKFLEGLYRAGLKK